MEVLAHEHAALRTACRDLRSLGRTQLVLQNKCGALTIQRGAGVILQYW